MALLAALCMGTGAFLFASNFSDFGILGIGVLGMGGTLISALIKLVKEISFRLSTGKWVKDKNSRIRTDDGKIKWIFLVPLISNILCNFLYTLVLSVGWKLAKASGLN